MVKVYSDRMTGNLLPPLHGLLFLTGKSSEVKSIRFNIHIKSKSWAQTPVLTGLSV